MPSAAPTPTMPPTFLQPSLPPDKKPIGLIITIIALSVVVVGAVVFGVWAFLGRQDYKDNVQQKIDAAVVVAEQETTEKNNARYAEEAKNPLKKYTGPSSYGSVEFMYPKTWSGYVKTVTTGSIPLQAYFHPDVVPEPGGGNEQKAVALQIEVRDTAYDRVVALQSGSIRAGTITASPYALPKVPDQIGTKFVGKIGSVLSGTQYVLPLRDKTLVITTYSDQYLPDVTNHVLASMTFVP